MQGKTQYNVRITSNIKVVLTIILVPLLTITPLIVLGALYGPAMPEWLEYTIIYGLLIAGGLLTLAIVKRASPSALMTLRDDGFSIDFKDKGIFARKSFSLQMSQVTGFSIEGNERYEYMSFSTSTSPSSFNVSASDKGLDEIADFDELKEKVSDMVAAHNNSPVESRPISTTSLYGKGFMKALAVVWLVIILAAAFNNLFRPMSEHIPLWRILAIAVIGIPLVWKVYMASYGDKK